MAGPYDSLNNPVVLTAGQIGYAVLDANGTPQSISVARPAAGTPCARVMCTNMASALFDNLQTPTGASLDANMNPLGVNE